MNPLAQKHQLRGTSVISLYGYIQMVDALQSIFNAEDCNFVYYNYNSIEYR